MCRAVYIHIPFCIKKCRYCDFNSSDDPGMGVDQYAGLLKAEIRQSTGLEQLTTIYFGGGTPSLFPPEEIAEIIQLLDSRFGIDPAAEITLEVNPGTVSSESLNGYLSGRVNRLSIGVQSLDDRFLSALGRVHSAAEAKAAFSLARQAGFENIGIDLIHSLPGQSLEDWCGTLAEAVAMQPEHISAYGLSIEPGTDFAAAYAAGQLEPAEEELSEEMFVLTSELLEKAGYEHYEVSNFAMAGRRSMHNQVYWQRQAYRGFGAGAHSFSLDGGFGSRWSNPEDIKSYAAMLQNSATPDKEQLTKTDAMAEFFFLGLRMLDGVNPEEFRQQFGNSIDETYPGLIRRLMENSLLQQNGNLLQLSSRGLLLSNRVLAEFLPTS